MRARPISDRAVPFAQSVEMFNTLRRLGGRHVALLQYRGEGHDLSRSSAADFRNRMQEFLDHMLKGEPAPIWWAGGVP